MPISCLLIDGMTIGENLNVLAGVALVPRDEKLAVNTIRTHLPLTSFDKASC